MEAGLSDISRRNDRSAAAFLFFNKGFGNAIPPREALPEEWSAEETDRFYEKLLRDKKIARRILIFLIPLLLVFLIDSLVLFLPGLLGL